MIDLRSDTVTRPTPAMRAAMARAEVGDDVFGDDPTTRELEETGAAMLGKEAAVFTASCTQSNLIALLTHCGRGDEYLVGQQAHTYLYEGGGGAALGGIQPQPLELEADGTLDLEKLARHIKPDDFHFARTRLLCLENTSLGRVLPLPYLAAAGAFAEARGLLLHLDGARIFNAAIASECGVGEIAAPFDSVSVCLSKGLGAPVGSFLAGGTAFIREARRWRKVVGGGMRQSGILAAAGLHALEHHIERLADDHANARALAEGLRALPGIDADPASVQSNMVYLRGAGDPGEIAAKLAAEDILVLPGTPMRLVTHLDVSADDIVRVIEAFARAV